MRKLDITDKLNFEERPILTIKGKNFTLDDSAPSVLKIMEMMGDSPTMTDMLDAGKIIFGQQYDEVLAMCGNFRNFVVTIETAMDLITDDSVGEQAETVTMTSSMTGI